MLPRGVTGWAGPWQVGHGRCGPRGWWEVRSGGLPRAACLEFREGRAGPVHKEQAQGSVRPADTCGSVQIIFG